MKKLFFALALLLSFSAAGIAQKENACAKGSADAICGVFLVTSPKNDVDKIKLHITRTTQGTYQGRIIWIYPEKNPDGSARTDQNNPDKSLRGRSATEILMFWGLKHDDGKWVGGTLYDPTSGKKYGIQLKMSSNGRDIEARYYKGRPVFGITQVWTRQ